VKSLSNSQIFLGLGIGLVVTLIASAAIGAMSFSLNQMISFLAQPLSLQDMTSSDTLERNVFLVLRLPRALLCAMTGAILGLSGAVMQGLFRNPIVEPGLIGTSAGAALGASVSFVFGAHPLLALAGPYAAPVLAFGGALLMTLLVYRLSASVGRVNVFTLLLAGIAVNAICTSGIGFMSYIARDPQARNITFWMLGTFTTANWRSVILVGLALLIIGAWTLRFGRELNVLMLGDDEATYLGIAPKTLILHLLVAVTLLVSIVTAMTGIISFVGLAVPHMLRFVRSSDYRFLLPASALLGAIVMSVGDIAARLIIAPAELPIGIISSLCGAPIFLWLLLRAKPHA
jgi:iron complex transport system permease protein